MSGIHEVRRADSALCTHTRAWDESTGFSPSPHTWACLLAAQEAARLSAEAKAAQLQADALNQQVAQLQSAAGQASVAMAAKSAELGELRAMAPEIQRDVAKARHR
jgi:hypothetical protein